MESLSVLFPTDEYFSICLVGSALSGYSEQDPDTNPQHPSAFNPTTNDQILHPLNDNGHVTPQIQQTGNRFKPQQPVLGEQNLMTKNKPFREKKKKITSKNKIKIIIIN